MGCENNFLDDSYILQIIFLDGNGLCPFFTPISKFLEIVCPVADTTRKNTQISETKFKDISQAFFFKMKHKKSKQLGTSETMRIHTLLTTGTTI